MAEKPNLLEVGKALQAIAQTGLAYAKDVFDRERYERVQEIATDLLAGQADVDPAVVRDLFLPEKGYATPKLDVRAAVFEHGRILLVRERSDGRWTLPGGWADVGSGPAAAAEKEAREEAGLEVRATKLLACLDMRRHAHPPSVFHIYKLIFRCERLGGTPTAGVETSDVGYFPEDGLPALSTPRITREQISRLFEHARRPDLPTDFD